MNRKGIFKRYESIKLAFSNYITQIMFWSEFTQTIQGKFELYPVTQDRYLPKVIQISIYPVTQGSSDFNLPHHPR